MHTAVDKWETWIPEIAPAHKRTPGPMRPGTVFDILILRGDRSRLLGPETGFDLR
jgi:hypothetical protein